MSGFVYIWLDRKHKRYYIGSHWGSPDDGYVCSSSWMKQAYKLRSQDFRRRIISVVSTSRKDLLLEEQRWLSFIKDKEIGKKYYNLRKRTDFHWIGDEEKSQAVRQKISQKTKGKVISLETRQKIAESNRGRTHTPEAKQKMSDGRKGMVFSDDHRANLSLKKKGKASPMKGQRFSEQVRKNMGGQNKGKIASDDTRQKMSQSRKGVRWYTDGVNDYRIREGEEVPENFRSGRTKGLNNIPMLIDLWNDPEYRRRMSDAHKKRKAAA